MVDPARSQPSTKVRRISGEAAPPRRAIEQAPRHPRRGALSTGQQAILVTIIVGFIAAIVDLANVFSFIQADGRIIGWGAVLMWPATLLESAALHQARLFRPYEDRRFRHGRIGLVALPPMALASFVLPTTKTTTLMLSGAYLGFWMLRRTFESNLIDLGADDRSEAAARRAGAREAQLARRTGAEPVLSICIDPHVVAARQGTVKRVRRLLERVTTLASVITVFAFGTLAVAGITDAVGFTTGRWHQPASHAKGDGGGGNKGAEPISPSSGGGQASQQPAAVAGAGSGGKSEGPCPPIKASNGAPASKVRELEALFSKEAEPGGKEGAVGRTATGCPVAVKERSTDDGPVYWTQGVAGGVTKSIAIVSPVYKNTIVIGPAVEPTEELLTEHKDLHGPSMFPRYYAAGGVYYLLYEGPEGTPAMLMGERVGTATEAQPLVLMRPPAVVAWISTVRELRRWLWPSVPLEEDDDLLETFRLRSTTSPAILESITYDRPNGEATRAAEEAPYRSSEEHLSPEQVAHWAPDPTP